MTEKNIIVNNSEVVCQKPEVWLTFSQKLTFREFFSKKFVRFRLPRLVSDWWTSLSAIFGPKTIYFGHFSTNFGSTFFQVLRSLIGFFHVFLRAFWTAWKKRPCVLMGIFYRTRQHCGFQCKNFSLVARLKSSFPDPDTKRSKMDLLGSKGPWGSEC